MIKLQNLKQFFLEHKLTIGLIFAIVLLLIGGWFLVSNSVLKNQTSVDVTEQDLIFDAEGPYAILSPRRDGNAMILNLKRTGSYDKITYELAYTSEGIDRGVMGEINTKDKKGEYEQEILFGTCSKNVCKYDTGVENGTLTLHIKKGKNAYRMVTLWHLQKPDIALGTLTSGDNHLTYQIDKSADISLIGNSIINDLSGAPKLQSDKQILGKVYSINVPSGKTLPAGLITIELAENPTSAVISHYDEIEGKWSDLQTTQSGSKLSAQAQNSGVFAVLIPKKSN